MFDSLTQRQKVPVPPGRDEVAIVHRFPFQGDDARLVEGLRLGHPAAIAHFYSLFAGKVHRVLFRILGPTADLEDTVHDTFVRALESIDKLRDAQALKSWVIGIAIFTARIHIQKRRRRSWLQFFSPEDLPERGFSGPPPEVSEAVRALSRVLDKMPTEERIAVVLRLAEGMTMPEGARACGVSISTFKRRFVRGEKIFQTFIGREPALQIWLTGETDAS